MFSWFRQLFALVSFNFRTLPSRLGSAAAAIFGIAGVVAVLVGVLSIGEGFRRVMVVQGKPDTALVLRGGSDSEMASVLVGPDVGVIESTPGIAKGADGKPIVGLITKTDINPFFVKMKEGATAKAGELGIELMTFAGKIDGDHETQQQAVESCIAAGVKGIMITASDTKAITDSLGQARDAGIPVVVSVIGTRDDPQGLRDQVAGLHDAGAWVFLSNAAAARTAVDLLASGGAA